MAPSADHIEAVGENIKNEIKMASFVPICALLGSLVVASSTWAWLAWVASATGFVSGGSWSLTQVKGLCGGGQCKPKPGLSSVVVLTEADGRTRGRAPDPIRPTSPAAGLRSRNSPAIDDEFLPTSRRAGGEHHRPSLLGPPQHARLHRRPRQRDQQSGGPDEYGASHRLHLLPRRAAGRLPLLRTLPWPRLLHRAQSGPLRRQPRPPNHLPQTRPGSLQRLLPVQSFKEWPAAVARAAPGDARPDLEPLALAPIAVVPCGGGEQFVLAALGPRYWTGKYDFRVFRSELGTWTKKVLALGAKNAMDPKKVIVLVGGEMGWVDLLRGILVCNDLLDDDPAFRVIPLPTLLPVNRVYTGRTPRSGEQFRDVVCVDGVIKLVEIEYCRRRVVHDVSKLEVLYDQDLSLTFGDIVDMEPDTYEYTGWRLLTWSRTVVSSNCWRRGSLLHVDDMTYSALLPPAGRRLLEKKNLLLPSYPILSMDSTDVVYLKCKMDPKDRKAWVVTLDIGKKTIQDVVPFPDEKVPGTQTSHYISLVQIS